MHVSTLAPKAAPPLTPNHGDISKEAWGALLLFLPLILNTKITGTGETKGRRGKNTTGEATVRRARGALRRVSKGSRNDLTGKGGEGKMEGGRGLGNCLLPKDED